MTPRDEVLAALARRRQATLAQLAEEIGDYYGVWRCLCSLRAEGKVLPPIRRGRPGRPSGSPARYRLSYTQRRRMYRGAASKGASRVKKLTLLLFASLALLVPTPAAFAQDFDSYPPDLFRNVLLQDMAGWYALECPFDPSENATGAACAVLPRSPDSARLWLDTEIMGYSDLVMVTPWSRGDASWVRTIYAEAVNQLIMIGITGISGGYDTLVAFIIYPPGYLLD